MVTQYIRAAWHWMWLVLFAGFVAGAITYVITELQPRVYEARARLVIGPGIEAINPDLNDLRAAAQLMWTYAEFVTAPAVLQQVIDEYELPMDVGTLRSSITVSPDQTTLWLTIRVRSNDMRQAVVIASALADSLVAMSPSNADGTDTQIKRSISNQVQKLEQDLEAVEAKLAADQAKLDETNVQDLQEFYQGRVAEHRTYASALRNSLRDLYALYQETYTNQVTLVESPLYAVAVDSNTIILVMLAAVAGSVASLAIVFAFEYFGTAIKTQQELKPRNSSRRADGKARRVPENKDNNLDFVDESRSKPSTATSANL